MDRETLFEPIVASVRKGTVFSRGEIMRAMADWNLTPIMVDGEHVGTLANLGTEVHIALIEGWKPRSSYRGAIRAFLQPIFDVHGFLTTKLRYSDVKERAFIERVGFRKTWADGNFQYFLLGSMPFEKRNQA